MGMKCDGIFMQLNRLLYGECRSSTIFKESKDNLNFIQRLELTSKLNVHNGCVNTTCWNDSGSVLLSGSDDQHLAVTNPYTQEVLTSVHTSHRANIFCARFLPCTSDKEVVSCSGDGKICYTNLEYGASNGAHIFDCHVATAYKVVVVPGDPHTFLSCGEDGTVRWFDLRTKMSCEKDDCKEDVLINCGRAASALCVNPMCPWQLATGCADSSIRIYDRRMLSTPGSGIDPDSSLQSLLNCFSAPDLEDKNKRITCLVYNENGQELLASYSSDSVYLFNLQNEEESKEFVVEETPQEIEEVVLSSILPDPDPLVVEEVESSRQGVGIQRLRLRGDWSDTGPNARPERERDPQREENPTSTIMQRMSAMLTRWLDTRVREAVEERNPNETNDEPSANEQRVGANEDSVLDEGGGEDMEMSGADGGGIGTDNQSAGNTEVIASTSAEIESQDTGRNNQGTGSMDVIASMSAEIEGAIGVKAVQSTEQKHAEYQNKEDVNKGNLVDIVKGNNGNDRTESSRVSSDKGEAGCKGTETVGAKKQQNILDLGQKNKDISDTKQILEADGDGSDLNLTKTQSHVTEDDSDIRFEDKEDAVQMFTGIDDSGIVFTETNQNDGRQKNDLNLTQATSHVTEDHSDTRSEDKEDLVTMATGVYDSGIAVAETNQNDLSIVTGDSGSISTSSQSLSYGLQEICDKSEHLDISEYSRRIPSVPRIVVQSEVSGQSCNSSSSSSRNDYEKAGARPRGSKTASLAKKSSSGNHKDSESHPQGFSNQSNITGTTTTVFDSRQKSRDESQTLSSGAQIYVKPPNITNKSSQTSDSCKIASETNVRKTGSKTKLLRKHGGSAERDNTGEASQRVNPGAIVFFTSDEGPCLDAEQDLHTDSHEDEEDEAVAMATVSQRQAPEVIATQQTSLSEPEVAMLKDDLKLSSDEDSESSDEFDLFASNSEDESHVEEGMTSVRSPSRFMARTMAARRLQNVFRKRKQEKAQKAEQARLHKMRLPKPPCERSFSGHRNARTMIKEVNFWGDRYVLSGSDCGHVFIWDKLTGRLVNLLEGDRHVVNCVQPHPYEPILATSGIDYNIKVWAPTSKDFTFDKDAANKVMERNGLMLAETRDTVTVPASFMLRLIASIHRVERSRNPEEED